MELIVGRSFRSRRASPIAPVKTPTGAAMMMPAKIPGAVDCAVRIAGGTAVTVVNTGGIDDRVIDILTIPGTIAITGIGATLISEQDKVSELGKSSEHTS